jgi:hypothetical protein
MYIWNGMNNVPNKIHINLFLKKNKKTKKQKNKKTKKQKKQKNKKKKNKKTKKQKTKTHELVNYLIILLRIISDKIK